MDKKKSPNAGSVAAAELPAFKTRRRTTVLRFRYETDIGSVAVCEIQNWDETRVYVRGYSTGTGELQIFRKNQIIEILSNDSLSGFIAGRVSPKSE